MSVSGRFLAFATALCLIAIGPPSSQASPEIPGAPQDHPIALVGATLHPVSGPEIESGKLLFADGRIAALGKDVVLPANVEVIELAGRHVYPGLIDAYTQLGLTEIGAVRATRDQTETGWYNPNVKAKVAFNPDSELIPVARSGGVLAVLTAPTGGLISGASSVMALDGWTWEDMVLRPEVGMHLNWPSMSNSGDGAATFDQEIEPFRRALDEARAYQKAKQATTPGAPEPPFDARAEAMLPVLDGRLPLFVHAEVSRQIEAAVAFTRREGLKMTLVGGYEAVECAEILKQADVPVIIAGVARLPFRRDDPFDAPFTLAQRLHEAGVRFCIASHAEASNVRNLPHHAGKAAAYGLPPSEALKAITEYPATILGLRDRMGALEAGLDATLIVTTGDPLEIATRVTDAYIQGRRVDLSDRHKRLWEKYREKYRRQAR